MPRKVQIALGVLAGVLLVILAGILAARDPDSVFSQLSRNIFAYHNSNRYRVGGGSAGAEQVSRLSIHWVGGEVVIKTGDQDDITFSEEGEGIIDADNRMRYLIENGTLTLQHKKSQPWYALFCMGDNTNKTLTVTLPQDLARLETVTVETVSASVLINGVQAQEVRAESVSGKIALTGVTCDRLRTDSVSGKISDQGSFKQAEAKSVSGSVSVVSEECPALADIQTVSGGLILQIPKINGGFTAVCDTTSGEIDCDFETKKSGNTLIYQNGAAQFKLKTVSGDISILMKTA